jgi:hypothetical protein
MPHSLSQSPRRLSHAAVARVRHAVAGARGARRSYANRRTKPSPRRTPTLVRRSSQG